jgi:hypothetical protein
MPAPRSDAAAMTKTAHLALVPIAALALCGGGCGTSSTRGTAGNGEGLSFAASVHYPVANPRSLALADFDGDGVKDVAVAATPPVVLFGAGDGTFGQPVEVGSNLDEAGEVMAWDANRDGRDDLFLGEPTVGNISISFGQSNRTLTAPTEIAGSTHGDFVLGDVDGDGVVDVLSQNESPDTGITFLAQGAKSSKSHYNFAGFDTSYAADLNGDGRADLVGPGTNVALIATDGKPHAFTSYPTQASSGSLVWGVDVDDDGLVDAVTEDDTAQPRSLLTQLAQSGGTLGGARTSTPPFEIVMGFGDLDGDGLPDAVVTDTQGFVGVLHGDGTGGFSSAGDDRHAHVEQRQRADLRHGERVRPVGFRRSVLPGQAEQDAVRGARGETSRPRTSARFATPSRRRLVRHLGIVTAALGVCTMSTEEDPFEQLVAQLRVDGHAEAAAKLGAGT